MFLKNYACSLAKIPAETLTQMINSAFNEAIFLREMKRIIATLVVFLGERGHIVFRLVLTMYNALSCIGWIKFTVGKTSEEILAWTEPFA